MLQAKAIWPARRWVLAIALVGFLGLMVGGEAGYASTTLQSQRLAQSQRTAQYRAWMVDAKRIYPYPQSIDKMWRVMMCESSGNPNASGGGGAWLGLFQYAPPTWRSGWNPYRNASIWDAKAQIYATAKAWSIGMQSHWSCYYKTPGR
jgi:hypothetical protein